MRRTTEDHAFADAARAELMARVRASAARPDDARRTRVREFAIAGLVAVGVVAVAVGVQQVRAPVGGGPTGAPAAPLTASASSSASASASDEADPAPSIQPDPSASSIPSASSASSAATLIGSPGAKVRTDAEIRSWAASVGNSTIWAEQAVLDVHCMAAKGFVYDPIYEATADLRAGHSGMSAADEQAFEVAEYGPQTSEPYDWRTAGCHGRSVHLTGQDHAH